MSLAALLATDVDARLAAIEGLAHDAPGAPHAIRESLLSDEDADVRAAAATWLGEARATCVGAALVDSLYDTHPSVRAASIRSLARLGNVARSALPTLTRLALEEPLWWVRRAAVLAAARIARRDALPLLHQVLDDPFWRVRHAAVRAIVALGGGGTAIEDALTSVTTSERARGALRYLEAKLHVAAGGGTVSAREYPAASGGTGTSDAATSSRIADPDPAVVAARLEHGARATPAELALYLGDPHAALRAAATRRLRGASDLRALVAATLWLEEPRIPHATAAVVALLDSLGPEVEELLGAVLEAPDARPGGAAWALSFISLGERWEHMESIVLALDAATPLVRRAAVSATGAWLASSRDPTPGRVRALARLTDTLHDPDEDVRRLAVHALVHAGDRVAASAVCALPFAEQPPLVRRLVARAAHELGDVTTLMLAACDDDTATRARGLSGLFAHGLLGNAARDEARASHDPWLRGAVLDDASALTILQRDLDPTLRRVAFEHATSKGDGLEAARLVVDDEDPWLRVRAAARLARSNGDEDLVHVLRLSRDPELAVRAAAADVLDLSRDLDERLLRVRDAGGLRDAVDTWLGRRAPALLESARAVTPTTETRQANPPHQRKELVAASARPLGQTGISLAPLVLSGANHPSVASLFRAMHAGCNGFFWEPRYRTLTAFLRAAAARHQHPVVIAGTYHATERAVRADVERALRVLDRDRLDVLLVFWTRSAARLEGDLPRTLERLRREGLIGAAGFSTHDRALAEAAIGTAPWDVVMVRHSAAHPGAEERLFAKAQQHNVGVLGFSATSYGRLLGSATTAADCYRYTLSQPGVSAVISAPRGGRELVENLEVLARPTLDAPRLAELRALGVRVREESRDFARYVRRFPTLPDHLRDAVADDLLDLELARSGDDGLGPS